MYAVLVSYLESFVYSHRYTSSSVISDGVGSCDITRFQRRLHQGVGVTKGFGQ